MLLSINIMDGYTKLLKGNTTSTLIQLFRYTWVGGFAFIIDYGVLYFITEYLYVNYLISAAFGFFLGLVTNYLLSTFWVFNNSRLKNRLAEFIVFAVIGIVGLALNEVIIYFCCEFFGIHYMISKLISTILVFFWNFFSRKYILFTNLSNYSRK